MNDLIEREAVLRALADLMIPHIHRVTANNAILAIPAATATGTQPSVNWDHLRPDLVAIARDEDGNGYAYAKVPDVMDNGWWGEGLSVSHFASYNPGTCDWRDSLVMRPGYKGDAE